MKGLISRNTVNDTVYHFKKPLITPTPAEMVLIL
jgi:hypothetical protein